MKPNAGPELLPEAGARYERTLEAVSSRPMLGFHGLGGAFGSFSPTLPDLARPALDTPLHFNCPIPFPIAGGTAPGRQSRDVYAGRPSLARESVPASLSADSWFY